MAGNAASPAPAALRRALVAGATGLVGRALVHALAQDTAYAEVHVLSRRALPAPAPRVQVHVADFETLAWLPPVDDVYIALGSTIKQAGSQAAFRRVDFDYVLRVAQLAQGSGATRLGVVSAMGADAQSRLFYNRVKGEMEAAVSALGYASVSIARPSFLAGDRARLDQAPRLGEHLALAAFAVAAPLIPMRYRAIRAETVAQALHRAVLAGAPGAQVLLSDTLQRLGH